LFETGIATGNTQLILVIRIVSVIWLCLCLLRPPELLVASVNPAIVPIYSHRLAKIAPNGLQDHLMSMIFI